MNSAVSLLQAVVLIQAVGLQNDASERMGVFQSVISRLRGRFPETGSLAELHPGSRHVTSLAQDRILVFTTREQPRITARELVAYLLSTL